MNELNWQDVLDQANRMCGQTCEDLFDIRDAKSILAQEQTLLDMVADIVNSFEAFDDSDLALGAHDIEVAHKIGIDPAKACIAFYKTINELKGTLMALRFASKNISFSIDLTEKIIFYLMQAIIYLGQMINCEK